MSTPSSRSLGGADSDCLLDFCERMRMQVPIEITYAWFNTGLEYEATKRHLNHLERRYGVRIERMRPEKSIPTCAREFGQPFVSKLASENMERLQKAGFEWEDEPLEVLVERYPGCKSALKWWTNRWTRTGYPEHFDIGRVSMLKEFIMANPPWFRISGKCCQYTKKNLAKRALRDLGCDLDIIGVRKAEGGMRAASNTCFTGGAVDKYRPLYWWDNATREEYERAFAITHSECYGTYGLKRTGCAMCPFGLIRDREHEVARTYEPKLFKAASIVFKDTIEYTRMFQEFRGRSTGQMVLNLRHARR